ncbi:MAG: hypothetical protein HOO67_04610 [Candidatus Peribacteraceae bacterium]|nr:hypothetical protein [Candidatus Peribacteraceae bacterium]
MTHRSCYIFVLLGTAFLIAFVMQVPQFLHTLDPGYQGVLVHLNSDEDVYFARVEEALTGRPERSGDAIVGDVGIIGTQVALFESVEGTLFRFTGWRAATVEQVMDSVVPPLLFLTLVLFFSLCGLSRWAAFAGALAFTVIEFYSLSRPVHQRDDFLVVFLAFSGIIAGLGGSAGVQRNFRWIWGVFGGMLLGILVGAYFWAWTYGWLWLALVFVWESAEWVRHRTPVSLRRIKCIVLFGLAGVVAALPSLVAWWRAAQNPLYADAAFRSGIYLSRMPESWPYMVLFTLMASGTVVAGWQRPAVMRRYKYLIILVLTSFIAIHQQVIHGAVFNFVSHYLFALVVGAIGLVLLWHAVRASGRSVLHVSAAAAVIYLAAIAYDGRYVLKQFTVTEGRFSEQHFATLLPVLDALPRSTVLSDPSSSLFVAGSTQHDVVYTLYIKNLLMSHEEVAERYCMTALAVPPEDRHFAEQGLIWPDANAAFPAALRGSDEAKAVRAREIALVEAACASTDKNPAAALEKFHVHYVLWDEKRNPEWDLTRLKMPLKKEAAGEGWSLWSLGTLSAPR